MSFTAASNWSHMRASIVPLRSPSSRRRYDFPSFRHDLRHEQNITSFFLVTKKRFAYARGKSYLRLELGDRSGTIEARMWDQFDAAVKDITATIRESASARRKFTAIGRSFRCSSCALPNPKRLTSPIFSCTQKKTSESLYAQLLEYANAIANPWLEETGHGNCVESGNRGEVQARSGGESDASRLLGGLLEHVISLCGLAKQIAAHYPELDVDLLLTAAILHDVGKLDELCYDAPSATPSKDSSSATS